VLGGLGRKTSKMETNPAKKWGECTNAPGSKKEKEPIKMRKISARMCVGKMPKKNLIFKQKGDGRALGGAKQWNRIKKIGRVIKEKTDGGTV